MMRALEGDERHAVLARPRDADGHGLASQHLPDADPTVEHDDRALVAQDTHPPPELEPPLAHRRHIVRQHADAVRVVPGQIGVHQVAGDGGGFLGVAAGTAADRLRKGAQPIGGDHDSIVYGCGHRGGNPMLTRIKRDHRSPMPRDQSTVRAARSAGTCCGSQLLSRPLARETSGCGGYRPLCCWPPAPSLDRYRPTPPPLHSTGRRPWRPRAARPSISTPGVAASASTTTSLVGERVDADFGITLKQVKLADTADAVARVLAEKTAARAAAAASI